MTKSGTLPIVAIGLPKALKIINFIYLNLLYKFSCPPSLGADQEVNFSP
jgi:hypothetical protein